MNIRTFLHYTSIAVLVLILNGIFTACPEPYTWPVLGVSLDRNELILNAGENTTLIATVTASAKNKEVLWESDNPLVASVDANGVVTALSEGRTKIRVTSEENEDVFDECEVLVLSADPDPGPDPDADFTLAANGIADTDDTTAITITFDKSVPGLIISNLAISNDDGSITAGTLNSVDDTEYILEVISVESAGYVTITITREGVTPNGVSVMVHRALGSSGSVHEVHFSGSTSTVTLNGLSNNKIYLIKVNTSDSLVDAGSTGSVQSVMSSIIDTINASPASHTPFVTMGRADAREFNANPPPFDWFERTGPSASFIPPDVGDTRMFWLDSGPDDSWESRQATLRAIGLHSNIWVIDDYYIDTAGNGNGSRISTSQAEALSFNFDTIYPAATNILGYEFGGEPGGNGGKDGDPRVQILVYNIDDNTGGYFWGKDYYNDSPVGQRSNEAEIFYINSSMVNSNLDFINSTMVHEFQHMVNFNVKARRLTPAGGTPAWYNEMLAMMAEDIIAPMIDIGPQSDGHPIRQRIPSFLNIYHSNSVTQWNNILDDYAGKYAFGAYLLRNFGGAQLVKDILANDSVGIPSISEALNKAYPGMDFEKALKQYGQAMIFSGSARPPGVMSFDNTVTNTINGITYTAQNFNIWTMQRRNSAAIGPVILDMPSRDMEPHTISVHSNSTWENVTGSTSITLNRPGNDAITMFLMIQ